MRYYIGDPCYIIPEAEWDEFVEATFLKSNQAKAQEYGSYCDSVFDWKGQKLIIWSNGGDGTWAFDGVETTNEKNSFCVDSGIFCIIELDELHDANRFNANRLGMLFDKKPDLYVEDGVVYINDRHDNSMTQCWACGHIVFRDDAEWECENGECGGCENCFECECEDDEDDD